MIKLFLCGDVMTGRGIDQILETPSDDFIHEEYVKRASGYVELAESAHGPIPRGVGPAYIWGAALGALERASPDFRIVNLETSVTTSSDWQPKGINYRMNPENIEALRAARIDCCVMANNHVLDWGEAGLLETISTLRNAAIRVVGAGIDDAEATQPAVLRASQGRVLVFAFGMPSSGVPESWAAKPARPGVAWLPNCSGESLEIARARISEWKEPGDLAVVSLHWGSNWGFEVDPTQKSFARGLIEAGADVVHGHSSHHPKKIEVHRGRVILYGCGDFINDYEGIDGYEEYRGDLALMYLLTLSGDGELIGLEIVPFTMNRFRLERARIEDSRWILKVIGLEARIRADGSLEILPEAARRGNLEM